MERNCQEGSNSVNGTHIEMISYGSRVKNDKTVDGVRDGVTMLRHDVVVVAKVHWLETTP